jgi:hypothetical protein
MSRDHAVQVLRPEFANLIDIVRTGHLDYKTGVPLDHQATLDAIARAKYVHCRIQYHMLLRYGQNGNNPIRIATSDSLSWLFVEGDPVNIMLRPKKGGRGTFLTRQTMTDRQTELRSGDPYLIDGMELEPLFLVYTERGGNTDAELTRIGLTSEQMVGKSMAEVVWSYVLWSADEGEGATPIGAGFDQPPLYPTVRVSPKAKPPVGGATENEADSSEHQKGG